MTWNVAKVFVVVALACFVLAAFGIAAVGPTQLLPLGLAFMAAGALVS